MTHSPAQEQYWTLSLEEALAKHSGDEARIMAAEAAFQLFEMEHAGETFLAFRPEWIEAALSDEIKPLFLEAEDPGGVSPMSGENTRQARRRRRNAGSLAALQRQLWYAITTAGDLLDDEDAQMRLKAVHAVAQAAAAYRALMETTELEARIEALEAAQATQGTKESSMSVKRRLQALEAKARPSYGLPDPVLVEPPPRAVQLLFENFQRDALDGTLHPQGRALLRQEIRKGLVVSPQVIEALVAAEAGT